jgi:hypothetical protein
MATSQEQLPLDSSSQQAPAVASLGETPSSSSTTNFKAPTPKQQVVKSASFSGNAKSQSNIHPAISKVLSMQDTELLPTSSRPNTASKSNLTQDNTDQIPTSSRPNNQISRTNSMQDNTDQNPTSSKLTLQNIDEMYEDILSKTSANPKTHQIAQIQQPNVLKDTLQQQHPVASSIQIPQIQPISIQQTSQAPPDLTAAFLQMTQMLKTQQDYFFSQFPQQKPSETITNATNNSNSNSSSSTTNNSVINNLKMNKFTGKKTEWKLWRSIIFMALRTKKSLWTIDEEGEDQMQLKPKNAKLAEEQNVESYNIIFLNLEQKVQEKMLSYLDHKSRIGDAAVAWKYLEKEYGTFTLTDKLALEQEFEHIVKKESEEMKTFLDRFCEIMRKLNAMSNEPGRLYITDEKAIMRLISALPKDWTQYIRSELKDTKRLTFEKIREELESIAEIEKFQAHSHTKSIELNNISGSTFLQKYFLYWNRRSVASR